MLTGELRDAGRNICRLPSETQRQAHLSPDGLVTPSETGDVAAVMEGGDSLQ